MNALIQAGEVITREAKRWEQLTAAAEVLKNLGSLDQAERESKERLAKLNQECEEAQAKVKAAKDLATKTEDEADKLLDDARAQVKKTLDEARDKAYDFVQVASEKAAANVVEAQTSASATSKRSADELAVAASKLSEIERQRKVAQGQVDAARQELVELEGNIAKARAQAKALIEG